MVIYLLLLLLLLVLSGFFSSSETAFLSLERVRLEHYVRERRPGAARVSGLLARPGRLLSAILLGNNLVNTGAAAVGTVIAAELISGGQAALAATLVITVLLVIFGEIGPKTVALHHNWTLTRFYAAPLTVWAAVMRPAVAALDLMGRVTVGAVGARREAAGALSLGELRTAIALGAESGALEEKQSDMLLGALTLQQRPVRRIMVHRVNMVTAESSVPRSGVTGGEAVSAGGPTTDHAPHAGGRKPESIDGLGCAGCRARNGRFGGCGSGWWRWQGATVAIRACGQEETAVGRRSQACWRQAVERSARPSGVRSGAGSPAAGRGRR